jgi:Ribbon-helix-helix protein, copG family
MSAGENEAVAYRLVLDSATYEKIRALAGKEYLSAAQVIRRAIRRELKTAEESTAAE